MLGSQLAKSGPIVGAFQLGELPVEILPSLFSPLKSLLVSSKLWFHHRVRSFGKHLLTAHSANFFRSLPIFGGVRKECCVLATLCALARMSRTVDAIHVSWERNQQASSCGAPLKPVLVNSFALQKNRVAEQRHSTST